MQNETIYAVGKYYSMEVGLKSIVDIPISGSFFVEISWLDSFHGRCCSGPPPTANPEPPICGGYGFVASPVCGKCAYLWYFPEIFVTWCLFFFFFFCDPTQTFFKYKTHFEVGFLVFELSK